jgi:hypothetical protein
LARTVNVAAGAVVGGVVLVLVEPVVLVGATVVGLVGATVVAAVVLGIVVAVVLAVVSGVAVVGAEDDPGVTVDSVVSPLLPQEDASARSSTAGKSARVVACMVHLSGLVPPLYAGAAATHRAQRPELLLRSGSADDAPGAGAELERPRRRADPFPEPLAQRVA